MMASGSFNRCCRRNLIAFSLIDVVNSMTVSYTHLDVYKRQAEGWLRYFGPDGAMALSPMEAALQEMQRAEQAQQQAEQAQQQAEQEHQRAERLAQRLRDLGVEHDDSIS